MQRTNSPWVARLLPTLGLGLLTLVATAAPGRADPPAAQLAAPVSAPPAPAPTAAGAPGPAEQAPPPREQAPQAKKELPDLAKAPPVLPPAQALPIDLCTALRLAESDNPTVGISRLTIQEALANQLRANSLLLPSLRAGTNFHRHLGVLQTSYGEIRHVESSSLYAGGGSRTLAAETVAFPMVQLFSPLADAFFEPLVARRLVAVRRNQSDATTNQVLLDVARRFLELVTAEAELDALKTTEEDMNKIVQLTAAFSRAGQGREADATRARGEGLLLHAEERRAEERVAVASDNLAELLNLDTAVRLQTPAQATGLLQLVGLQTDLEALVVMAQANRPELAAIAAEIARRQAQVRQETFRPLLPTLSVGYSTGTFGGGTNRVDLVKIGSSFGNFGSRADFDVVAYWTMQNAGLGNRALQSERRAQRELSVDEQLRLLNMVRREVIAAFNRSEAGLRRVQIAQRQLRDAEAGFQEDLRRIQGGVGLPIEVLNSVNRLGRARLAVIQTLLEYNLGQFELFVALGQRPTNACLPANCAPQ